jgi:hypothetical protein
MSIGTPHHRLKQATVPKLKALIATPSFQRMWARPFKVDVTHEVPDTSGFNVLGTVYYLDKDFYAAVMSGQIQVPGMTSETIIQAALIHDRTEKCALDADSNVDEFLGTAGGREPGAHEYATLAEHEFVRKFTTPRAYEAGLRKIMWFNEHKPISNPPLDLDCEAYIDEMDAEDSRVITEMAELHVTDATKLAKSKVKYGHPTGPGRCIRCLNWMGRQASQLAPCRLVSGAVRNTRGCEKFEVASMASPWLHQYCKDRRLIYLGVLVLLIATYFIATSSPFAPHSLQECREEAARSGARHGTEALSRDAAAPRYRHSFLPGACRPPMERVDQACGSSGNGQLTVAGIGICVLDEVARRAQPVERGGLHPARGPLQVLRWTAARGLRAVTGRMPQTAR